MSLLQRTEATGASVDRLLAVSEICQRLSISRSTFYDWRQARKAPPCLVLPNGQIRIRESDLDEWITGRMEAI